MTTIVQLRDKTRWDSCRSCGRNWQQVSHESGGRCRTCHRADYPFDLNSKPVKISYFETIEPELQALALPQQTLDEKGYDIDDLTRGSTKKIIHKCDVCGELKETPFKLFVQGKNLSHNHCKSSKTEITNTERYGVTNTRNINLGKRLGVKEQEIIKSFEDEGYDVVSVAREEAEIRVCFICPRGHKHGITWGAWKRQEQRCGRCFGNNGKITFEKIKEELEAEEYVVLSLEYQDHLTPIKYRCPKGHINVTAWKYWQRGCRCPDCRPSSSRGEEEVRQAFSDYNPFKTRSIIPPYELDIYFPEHKVAVEYCGLYWHSDKHDRIHPSYHYDKMKACEEQGIRLITLFEDEWLGKKEICISRIGNALGVAGSRIYARNCEVRAIAKDESSAFFESNHLQGRSRGVKQSLGLYCNDKLVYAVALGAPSRAHTSKGKKVLELKRMAPQKGMVVVGGASKIFKAVIQYAMSNGYEQIKSYCDLRWGTGKVYQILGMCQEAVTNYTPHYTNGRIRYRNQTFANKDTKGFYKIYDCGHQTWVLDLI